MERTFGERFLEEYLRAGGAADHWPPKAKAALKKSDRRSFIDALSRASADLAKTLIIAAHTAEPETLARRAAAARARGDGEDDVSLFFLL